MLRSLFRALLLLLACFALGCEGESACPSSDAGVCRCDSEPDASKPDGSCPVLIDAGTPAEDAGTDDASTPDAGQPPAARCGLLLNGNAESGSIAPWISDFGDFKASQNTPGSTPSPVEGGWFFFAGVAPSSQMHQEIGLEDMAAEIDQGGLNAHLSGWLRDWEQADLAQLGLEALGVDGTVLAQTRLPGFDHDQWTRRQVSIALPAGTRMVRATLAGERTAGSDNDAYFDGLDLCIDGERPTGEEELVIKPYVNLVSPTEALVSWEGAVAASGSVAFGPTRELGSTATDSTEATLHHVRLAGLTPGAEVFYRIASTLFPGKLHSFRAPPAARQPLSFTVWGDSQYGTSVFTPIVARMAERNPQLVLSVGDTVDSGTDANYVHQLFIPWEPLGEVPMIVSTGNHNTYEDPTLALFDHYLPIGRCGGIRVGPVYLLRLDTNGPMPGGANQTCLDQAKADPEFATAAFRIVFFHEPPRIEYWDGGGVTSTDWVREQLEPQLVEASFDLALTGHSHLYTYGPPVNGITWVTTGGGGGNLEPESSQTYDWPEITVAIFRHHFLHVTAEEQRLSVAAIADTGEVLHSFEITRAASR